MAGQKNLAGLAEQQSGLLSGHMNDLFQLDDVQLDRPDLQGSVDSRNMRTTLDPRGRFWIVLMAVVTLLEHMARMILVRIASGSRAR